MVTGHFLKSYTDHFFSDFFTPRRLISLQIQVNERKWFISFQLRNVLEIRAFSFNHAANNVVRFNVECSCNNDLRNWYTILLYTQISITTSESNFPSYFAGQRKIVKQFFFQIYRVKPKKSYLHLYHHLYQLPLVHPLHQIHWFLR